MMTLCRIPLVPHGSKKDTAQATRQPSQSRIKMGMAEAMPIITRHKGEITLLSAIRLQQI